MKVSSWQKLCEYIDECLDTDLSVDALSQRFNCSRFHFHRLFMASTGQTLGAYVRSRRLYKAACRLAYRQHTPIIDIALDSGYQSHEAFSRAFKRVFNLSPTDFRQQPNWDYWQDFQQQSDGVRNTVITENNFQVNIQQLNEVALHELTHIGPMQTLGQSLRRFIEWRKQVGLSPAISRTFNILYDDPSAVAPEEYRFGLCAEASKDVTELKAEMKTRILPAGRYARIRVTGGDSQLEPAITWMYRHWLPNSEEAVADHPLLIERLNLFPEVPPHQLELDILLLLQDK